MIMIFLCGLMVLCILFIFLLVVMRSVVILDSDYLNAIFSTS